MNFNNKRIYSDQLRGIVFILCRLGLKRSDILLLLRGFPFPVLTEGMNDAKKSIKKSALPVSAEDAYQSQVAYLALLSSNQNRNTGEDLLLDILWQHLQLGKTIDRADTLQEQYAAFMVVDVSDENMPYANLLAAIFDISFIREETDWNKFFDKAFTLQFLASSYWKSVFSVHEYDFPKNADELLRQMGLYIIEEKGPLRIGVELLWDDPETIVTIWKIIGAKLSQEEQLVLIFRFGIGLGPGASHTVKETALHLQCDVGYVRYIESKAVSILRHPLQMDILERVFIPGYIPFGASDKSLTTLDNIACGNNVKVVPISSKKRKR